MAEEDADRIVRSLLMVSALARRVLEGGQAAGAEIVTDPQLVVLKWLDGEVPRRAGDVARFLACSAPAATQFLARLQRKRLITRHRSREDARAGELRVTARARRLIAAHDRARAAAAARLAASVSSADRELISTGLEGALGMLLAAGAEADDLCLHCDALRSPACVRLVRGRACPVRKVRLRT
jgi:DNA-binding MarR family transcriptional regulator